MWPMLAFAAVVTAGIIAPLFFTSSAALRVVVVNDTSAPLRTFYRANTSCTRGSSTGDARLAPGGGRGGVL